MTIENLERVLWRLREKKPFYEGDIYSIMQLENAIMHECGTDPRTIKINYNSLKKLEWIKRINKWKVKIIKED